MWEPNDKNLSLHDSGATVKYTKSSSPSISKHKKKLNKYMNYTIVLKLNYITPVSIGIIYNLKYTELINSRGSKLLTFKLENSNISIIYGNVLMSEYKLENSNMFNLAICFFRLYKLYYCSRRNRNRNRNHRTI